MMATLAARVAVQEVRIGNLDESKKTHPQTMEDLLCWQPFIRKQGLRTGIPTSEIDDFVLQVVFEFFEGGYLSIFDPARSKFTTFLWNFVTTRAKRDRDRYLREDKRRVWLDAVEDPDEDDQLCLPPDPVDLIEEREDNAALAAVLEPLHAVPTMEIVTHDFEITEFDAADRPILKTYRLTIERSLYSLALLMLLGFSQREIASVYKRSIGTVASMVQQLRSQPSVVRAVLGIHPASRTLYDD